MFTLWLRLSFKFRSLYNRYSKRRLNVHPCISFFLTPILDIRMKNGTAALLWFHEEEKEFIADDNMSEVIDVMAASLHVVNLLHYDPLDHSPSRHTVLRHLMCDYRSHVKAWRLRQVRRCRTTHSEKQLYEYIELYKDAYIKELELSFKISIHI